ncbi:hypothetical protein [Adhaeribacter terreus]|uniref:YD repeat-containing protein n=1 Tax=Adhaeribacter terreus TaxID=529703 RepID=A0ABW0EES4_9BACT
MKKVNALVLGLAVLLAFGCGGDEPEPVNPDSNNNPDNSNTVKCLITRRIHDSPTVYTTTYELNAQNKVLKSTSYTNGSYRYESVYEYDNLGRKIKAERKDGNFIIEYFTFEYNAAGQLEKRTNFYRGSSTSPLTLNGWYFYEYDTSNRLIKWSDFASGSPNAPMAFRNYAYPAANKITEALYIIKSGTPTWQDSIEYILDGHKRPLTTGSSLDKMELLTNQNILSEKQTYDNGPGTTINIENYTYQYNADGFPTQVMRSFNGSPSVLHADYTYNCQ